jgi:hypothetical protein
MESIITTSLKEVCPATQKNIRDDTIFKPDSLFSALTSPIGRIAGRSE